MTALTVTRSKTPVINFDPRNLNYDLYRETVERSEGARGGMFKGTEITFKQGEYVVGYGNDAEVVDELKLVVNFPYAMRAWRKLAKGVKPEYAAVAMIGEGQMLPPRADLGDMDKADWPQSTKGKNKGEPMDPWSELLVLMCRTKKGAELFHFTASTVSSRIAVGQLLIDIVTDAPRQHGKLPVVVFGTSKAENKNGERFDVPTFEIVEWVKATDADYPDDLTAPVEDDQDDEETKALLPKPKATARKAKKPVVEDDEDDEADEEEVAPAPARASKKRKAAPAPVVEDDEDDEDDDADDAEDEEEEVVVKKPKAVAKAASRTGKKRTGRFD